MNKKIMSLCLFIIIMLISTNVFATVQASLKIELEPTELKPGDNLTVTLKVQNISGTTNGIKSFDGIIEYDKSIFEEVQNSSLSISNGSGEFNKETGKFAVDLNNAIKTDSTLITVNLKVKANATVGKTENAIKFKEVKLATGLEGSVTLEQSSSVTIISNSTSNNNSDNNNNTNNEETSNDNNSSNNNNNTINNNESNLNNNSSQQQNVENDTTIAPYILPNTGIIKIGLGIFVVLAILYICYRKYKDIEI